MFISNQQMQKAIQAFFQRFQFLLLTQRFYLLGVFSTLAVLHLDIIRNHRTEGEQITFYALYWGGLLYLIWQIKRQEYTPSFLSSCLGSFLLFIVIFRPINLWHLDLMLFRFGPIIAGLGLGLLFFGFAEIRHYWRLFLLLCLMLSPFGFINGVFNTRLHFPELTATISAFLLHYLGFGATHSGNLVKLPTGQVEVIYYCTGGLLIVWLLQLTLLILVVVSPLTWKQRWGLVISAVSTGFLIGCIRVALLAVVVNNKSLFDYWHGQTGGTIFMAIATISYAALCNWILPVDFLSPTTNPIQTTTFIEPKRRFLLAGTWSGIIVTAIYLIASKQPIGTAIFPEAIAVNNWQLINVKSLNQYKYKNTVTDKFEVVQSGQDYSYLKNGQKLAVQMRYVINTRGEPNPFVYQLSKELMKESQNNIKQLTGIGYYALYSDGKQAYLTACINPRGGSTVISSQFMKNRYKYDVNFKKLIPWFLGQNVLRDDRCIWTQLSMPLSDVIATDNYTVLESLWKDNYSTWQSLLMKNY
ncbi:cyanoexosortase A system-associated protein [Anabaena sp. UHCC 0451]|uniref:cyanoexosortase A system-associated protein n=1 Tax=Anabaena sp. UHCC 0451 TaxID=2055235 RepID=UPI002B21A1F5|nr:cyanoexosortase A system-associated protein [Anabaena sp. UHCC 0451]MEA5575962.1 cyanoexosortase A system-associated protein [Anabaena sp. UHCC 0451]